MRKSSNPRLLVNKQGQAFGIATGSSHTAEHEWGAEELLLELTGTGLLRPETVAEQMRANPGELRVYPDLLDNSVIAHDLENIVFESRTVEGERQAVRAYSTCSHLQPFDDCFVREELGLAPGKAPSGLASAWGPRSFAFKVAGADQVALLKDFADAMKAGKALFANKFLSAYQGAPVSGIVIVRADLLELEHLSAIRQANTQFEMAVKALLHPVSA